MDVYVSGVIVIGVLFVFIGVPIITVCYCRKKKYNIIQ